MLKVLGLGIVVAASTAIGFVMGQGLENRVRELTELKHLFVMLQGEIKYGKTPLIESFYKISKRVKPPFREFLLSLAGELEKKDGRSLSAIFGSEAGRKFGGGSLTKEDLDQLKTAGSHLGYLDVEMQLRTIDLYLEQVNESCVQARQEYQNKSRMYHCLGVMGGLFVALIFI